jgi:predicted nucleic acid-binding protein
MFAVSNTSPVRYLVLLGQAELIGRLFGAVLIPQAVERELLDPRGPLAVRQWMAQCPAWLKVHKIKGPPGEKLRALLDPGESEAIQLALEMQAAVIVLDERRGREVASFKGLPVIGVLGILREAYRQGWISDPLELLRRLRAHGFRISLPLARRFQEQIRMARPEWLDG